MILINKIFEKVIENNTTNDTTKTIEEQPIILYQILKAIKENYNNKI